MLTSCVIIMCFLGGFLGGVATMLVISIIVAYISKEKDHKEEIRRLEELVDEKTKTKRPCGFRKDEES